MDLLKLMIDKLEECSLNYHLIEMLKMFINKSGSVFAKTIPKEFREKINDFCNRKCESANHFLLVDIKEKLDEWIDNIQPKRAKTNQVVIKSNDKERMFKSVYSSYQEDETQLIDVLINENIQPTDFIEVGISFLPDQKIDDIYYFTSFICSSMDYLINKNKKKHKKQLDKEQINKFKELIEQFKEKDVVSDNSYIWYFVSVLISNLIIFDLLTIKDARELHEAISNNKWNEIDDLKWFLHDFHDFSETIENYTLVNEIKEGAKGFKEILDALKMPDLINTFDSKLKKFIFKQRQEQDAHISRLIAVSIVRSIFSSIRLGKEKSTKKYHNLLQYALSKQEKAIKESIDEEYENDPEFPIKKEDFLPQC